MEGLKERSIMRTIDSDRLQAELTELEEVLARFENSLTGVHNVDLELVERRFETLLASVTSDSAFVDRLRGLEKRVSH